MNKDEKKLLYPFQKDMIEWIDSQPKGVLPGQTVEVFNNDIKEWDWSWGNAMLWAENQDKKN